MSATEYMCIPKFSINCAFETTFSNKLTYDRFVRSALVDGLSKLIRPINDALKVLLLLNASDETFYPETAIPLGMKFCNQSPSPQTDKYTLISSA